MNNQNTAVLVRSLCRHMMALRMVPRSLGWKHGIPNAADGACFDYRINLELFYDEARGEVVGPFLSEMISTRHCFVVRCQERYTVVGMR